MDVQAPGRVLAALRHANADLWQESGFPETPPSKGMTSRSTGARRPQHARQRPTTPNT